MRTVIILITLLLPRGPDAINRNELRAMFKQTRHYYRHIGVDLRIKKLRILRRDPSIFLDGTLSTQIPRFNFWRSWIAKRYGDGGIKFAALPPVHFDGSLWIYGVANVCAEGAANPLGLTTARTGEKEKNPEYTYRLNTAAFMHEMGHILGAHHDLSESPVTLMHPFVLQFISEHWPLPISARNIFYIKSCVGLR